MCRAPISTTISHQYAPQSLIMHISNEVYVYKQNGCARQLCVVILRHLPAIWWSRDAPLHQTCIVTNIDSTLWAPRAAQSGFYRLYRFFLI